MANSFNWNTGNGAWSVAADWFDTTSATAGPPTSADYANFYGSGGTISGSGTAADVQFGSYGNWVYSSLSLTIAGAASSYLPIAMYLGIGTNLTVAGGTVNASAGYVAVDNAGGTLLVNGGAVVTTLSSGIGDNVGNGGSLVISGAGSSWHDIANASLVPAGRSTGYINIGAGPGGGTIGGNGEILVTSQASLTEDAYATLGATTGSNGLVTVSTQAVWTVTGGLNDGQGGVGTVDIVNTGTFIGGGTYDLLGNNAGALGVALVDGSGSSWSSAGQLVIGNFGAGAMTVSNSAHVTAQSLAVGALAQSNGALTVQSGGVVTTPGNIVVGNTSGSSGVVRVLAGSTLASTAPLNDGTYEISIGQNGTSLDSSGNIIAAASGTIYVEGSGALLTTNGNPMRVGGGGSGSLIITAGGTVVDGVKDETNDSATAVGSSGTGTISVSGAGSSFTSNGSMYLAHSGSGVLLVQNSATATIGDSLSGLAIGDGGTNGFGGAGSATIASGGGLKVLTNIVVGLAGDSGVLVVKNGTVEATNRLLVGDAGNTINGTLETATGAVLISGGGTVLADGSLITASNTGDVVAGFSLGDVGSIAVTGTGSLLNTEGHYITIGRSGSGMMTVTQGGTVLAGIQFSADAATSIGANAGAQGTLTVSDPGSTYTAVGQINVGNYAAGTLVVENHGTLVSGGSTLSPSSGIAIGHFAGAIGQVLVAGTGSELVNVGGFRVGGNGTTSTAGGLGSLVIESGGLVQTTRTDSPSLTNPAAAIGASIGSDGSGVSVAGTGSSWQITGPLLVGQAAQAELTVVGGGTVSASQVDAGVLAGSAGDIAISGAGSNLTIAGQLTVGDAAAADLEIINGGHVSAADGDLGLNSGGSGNVDLEGTGSTLAFSDSLNVGDAGVGILTLGQGTTLSVVNNLNTGISGIINSLGGTIDPANETNSGRIGGTGLLTVSQVLTNKGTIYAQGGTYEVNAGTITGTGVLEMDPGGSLRLDGPVGSGQSISFVDSTGTLVLQQPTGFAAGVINGFVAGDKILLENTPVANQSFNPATGALTLTDAGGNTIDTLSFSGTHTASDFTNSVVPVPCFGEGTRILTVQGEIAVEALRVGDEIPVLLGRRVARISWIGHRRIDCGRHPRPWDVRPIRVHAHAFGQGRPHRDLTLSPDHAVYANGVLIPIRYLVNDATIVQTGIDAVTYWHIELDAHDILLAEGLAAESFLDTGNRGALHGGGAVIQAIPDFAPDLAPDLAPGIWHEHGCAKLILSGPILAAARSRLLAQARKLGHSPTFAPALHLLADGQPCSPSIDGDCYRFDLPEGVTTIRLISRTGRPAAMQTESDDCRHLGVAVIRVMVDGVDIPAGDPRRSTGWLPPEPGWQWTDGEAGLTCAGARRVVLSVARLMPYWNRSGTGGLHRGAMDPAPPAFSRSAVDHNQSRITEGGFAAGLNLAIEQMLGA